MKSIIVDTNAFLRFFLNDIPEQKKEFEKLVKQAKKSKNPLVVPHIVIFEINFILDKYYGISKEEIINKLGSIISSSYFRVQDRTLFKLALNIYSSNNISLADSFILAYAREEEGEFFTFDENLKKLSNK